MYLAFVHVFRVGQTNDIRVEWTFGAQLPDLIQIIWNVVGWSQEAASGTQVAIDQWNPRGETITAPAPGRIRVEVYPRLLDESGRVRPLMPNAEGVELDFREFVTVQEVDLTGPSQPYSGGGEALPAPVITATELTPDRLVIRWKSRQYDFFHVIWSMNGRRQPQVKIDSSAHSGYYVVERPRPNTTYTFQVQGCISTLIGRPACSPWSAKAEGALGSEEGWRPFPISPAGAARAGSPLAAVVRDQQVDLFWIGPDGAIGTSWTRPGHDWERPFRISPPGAARADSPLAAVLRKEQVDLFWVGLDGAVGTTWTRPGRNWERPFAIYAGGATQVGSRLAAVVRDQQVDLFWVGPDGAIGSSYSRPNLEGGRWQRPYAISRPRASRAQSPLSAAVRGEQVDAFWVGPDGAIGSSWTRPGRNWERPYPISRPRAAQDGSPLLTTVRKDQVDAFWIGSDGAIGTNYSTPRLAW
jgi:hypothetical protein